MSEIPERETNPGVQEKLFVAQNMTAQSASKGCTDSHQDEEPPLGTALFRVSRAMFFENKPIPELNALPMAQLRLLWAVRFSPDATMKDLSDRLSVSQSTVTQLADRLVRRNFVVRNADTQDRRIVRLRLSGPGLEIIQKADNERRSMIRATWNILSEGEQQEVMQGLEILGRAAEAARTAQGRPLPPLTNRISGAASNTSQDDSSAQNYPVVDLMTIRVRGRNET